jgi:hypothetical protein
MGYTLATPGTPESEAQRLAWRIRNKKYRQNYPDKIKAIQAGTRLKRKRKVMNAYGGRCACCGIDDIRVLVLDHVNGGGTQHRAELSRRGQQMYTWVIREGFPEGFQVLCANCNLAKWDGPSCPIKH